jgi:iron complex outermembrane recepter protein
MFGLDGMRWQRDVLGAFGSVAHQDSRGFYIRDSVRMANGLRIDAGVRAEKVDKDNSSSSASISDRLNAWELGASVPVGGATAYARAGQSFRLANVDEFSFTSSGVSLLPQTSKDFEVGARWSYAGGKTELRAYRNNLTNEIGFDPNAAGPFIGFAGANVNLDPTRRQGLELDTRHQLTRSFELRINAALRRATFRSGPYSGTDVPQVPRESVAVRGDWTPAAGHRLNGGVNWVGEQHPDFGNACTMPAYSTVDLRYAYQWNQVELSLGVANLFDRKYFTQAFGCSAGVTTSIYPDPGRTFTGAVRVSF